MRSLDRLGSPIPALFLTALSHESLRHRLVFGLMPRSSGNIYHTPPTDPSLAVRTRLLVSSEKVYYMRSELSLEEPSRDIA